MFRELLYFIRVNMGLFLIVLLIFIFGCFVGFIFGFQLENDTYTAQEIEEIKSIIEEESAFAAIEPNMDNKNLDKELSALESAGEVNEPKEPLIEEEPKVKDESALAKWRNLVNIMRENQDGVKAKLYENAEAYWTENGVSNYSMIEDDYQDQLKSFDEFLHTFNQRNFNGTINEIILMQAFIDYPFDYKMIMYVYRKELKAYNSLHE